MGRDYPDSDRHGAWPCDASGGGRALAFQGPLGGIVGIHPLVQIFLIVMIIELIKVGLSSNT